MSSDGRRMIVNEVRYESEASVESRVIVFDTVTAEILTEQTYDEELHAQWIGDELIGLAGGLNAGLPSLSVLSATDLEPRGTIEDWEAEAGPVRDGEIWATSYSGGSLFRASIDDGTVETATTFSATTSGRVVLIDQPIDSPSELVAPFAGVEIGEGSELTSEMPTEFDGTDDAPTPVAESAAADGDAAAQSGESSGSATVWIILGLLVGVAAGVGLGLFRRRS